MLLAFFLRLACVLVLAVTDAIDLLRLSPDSERYHRDGLYIMGQMQGGFFNWSNWIDNGWFQFTGLVYYLFGSHPILIQLVNVCLGTATVFMAHRVALFATFNFRIARLTALFVAVFPSFVYWSSLMLKDPLAILAMTMLAYGTLLARRRFSVKALALIVSALLAFLATREYMFFVAIVLVIASVFLFSGLGRAMQNSGLLLLLTLAFLPAVFGFGLFGSRFFQESRYLDLNYINHVREAMGDRGTGAIFEADSVATWGSDWSSNLTAAATGIFFFFFSLDFTSIGSVRQLMALPEALLFVLLLPCFFTGLKLFWRARAQTIPVLLITFGVMAVYVSATTNLGALFRWKMQVMPFLTMIIATGIFAKGRGLAFRIARRLV